MFGGQGDKLVSSSYNKVDNMRGIIIHPAVVAKQVFINHILSRLLLELLS